MKKTFTKKYIAENKGCYSIDKVNTLSFYTKEEITIEEISESEISLKDKFWFLVKKCELTTLQKQLLAISVAESVLPIYEAKYPGNYAPREAIQAAKDYLAGSITIDILRTKRAATDSTYAATDAAAAATATADAYSAYSAYSATYAAIYDPTYSATYAAADAAAAYAAADAYSADAKTVNYTASLLNILNEFIKNN